MVNSMTGFASRTGQGAGHGWSWELRSVNGKGLDLRVRLPEGVDGLEAALRTRLGQSVKRGSLSVGLKLTRQEAESLPAVDAGALDRALMALAQVQAAADARGLTLRPPSGAEVLALRGVQAQGAQEIETTALRIALLEDFEAVLSEFLEMRAREGAALQAVLAEQVDRIEALQAEASAALPARTETAGAALRAALARVLENSDGADEARVAQELAVLAVKSDITEEIDRLGAHVAAARALLAQDGPVGRKLDFLTQEFNREANTLCSKSQDVALTRIGLDLKAAIDQIRQQVQNVE